jgi:hypothetical protein
METGVSRREADQGLRCVLDTGVFSLGGGKSGESHGVCVF